MNLDINPLIAAGVLASTAITDAAYVFFTSAVIARHRFRAANWSAMWYLLSAFAVISYTSNPIYVAFAALGSGSAPSPPSPSCIASKARDTIRPEPPAPPCPSRGMPA